MLTFVLALMVVVVGIAVAGYVIIDLIKTPSISRGFGTPTSTQGEQTKENTDAPKHRRPE